ncbi:MAG: transposase [Phycisphaerales bacterium]
MAALAYLLTWTCHGTWLPGDERGWVDHEHNEFGTPINAPDAKVERASRDRSESDARVLDDDARRVVAHAVRDHCEHARWKLLALNVRTNHVHCVVSNEGSRPEIVMAQLKSWATRRLREAGLRGRERVWTREGSTRHLFDQRSLALAVDYVNDRQ